YKLCISKKVNNGYSVVWAGSGFGVQNTFRWEEEYQLFAQTTFKEGALVEAKTNVVDMVYGQHATITNNGRINTQPIQIPEGATFYIDNQYMPCYIGLNQKLNGVFAPAFLDQYLNIFGPSDITPLVTVMVFFSRTLETSSMFLNVSSSVCEIAYQGAVQKAVEYTDVKGNGNGMW
ncbi:hypothetical protein B0H16DRAFT_1243015, partial [Mycena metata]